MDEPKQRFTLELPVRLHREAKALAALQGRSLADVIRESLEQWIAASKEIEELRKKK